MSPSVTVAGCDSDFGGPSVFDTTASFFVRRDLATSNLARYTNSTRRAAAREGHLGRVRLGVGEQEPCPEAPDDRLTGAERNLERSVQMPKIRHRMLNIPRIFREILGADLS